MLCLPIKVVPLLDVAEDDSSNKINYRGEETSLLIP